MTEDIGMLTIQEYLLLNWTLMVASDQFFQNKPMLIFLGFLTSLKALTVIRTLSKLAKQGYACRS